MISVMYRPPTPEDLNFITNSWLKSNRSSTFAYYIDREDYYRIHENLVKIILERSLATIICDPEDHSHVYGYAVYELNNDVLVLHYLYIKYAYRNFGLAKSCLKAVYPKFGEKDIFLTHIDKVFKNNSCFIKNRDKYKLHYNPYLMAQ